MKTIKKITIAAVAAAALVGLSACASDADVSRENASRAAEQFEIQREIVGINLRTGEDLFSYIGKCSLESGSGDSMMPGYIQITCKHGDGDIRNHYVKENPEAWIAMHQLEPLDVSEYHTRIIIKPENLIPEIDLETSGEG